MVLRYLLQLCLCFSQGFYVLAASNRVPHFANEFIIKSIKEEQPVGAYILRTTATDGDGDVIFYSIEDDTNSYFAINNENGEIRTAKVIDREKLDSNSIKFNVVAAEFNAPDQRSSQEIVIHITDINDNEPIIKPEYRTVNVSELSAINILVTKITATDTDENPELLYSIVGGNEERMFTINLEYGDVYLAKTLDFEKTKEYILQVQVTDGRPSDKSRHIKTSQVHVFVVDEDDNGPMFYLNYSANIKEGEYFGEVIKQVQAHDLDKEIKSPMSYTIDARSNVGNVFSVDSEGNVRVTGRVDREVTPTYQLIIHANQVSSSVSHPSAQTILVVTVTDINDNRPVFEHSNYIGSVKEHEQYGTVVLRVKAHDNDEGVNAAFIYVLQSANNVFGISQQGDIFIQEDVDREMKNIYQFRVMARQEKFPVDSYTEVTIIVNDTNDHSPVFSKDLYKASVFENEAKGVFIVDVLATDLDKDDNAKVEYSIVPDAEGASLCFKIDKRIGRLVSICSLDREKADVYSFLVQATDKGKIEQRRSTTSKVLVRVEDRNDNVPLFEKLDYFKSLHYDEEVNAPIVQVKALDSDAKMFGTVYYRIASGNELDRFHLGKETGQLKVAASLAAYAGKFWLRIQAYDNNGIAPSNLCPETVLVTITVDKTGSNSVVLQLNVGLPLVQDNEETIVSNLRSILGMGITTDSIEEDDINTKNTKLIFHGYNDNTFALVKKDAVVKALDNAGGRAMSRFRRAWNVTGWRMQGATVGPFADHKNGDANNDKQNNRVNPIIYAVLGFAALIAIFGMIGMIILIKSKRRNSYDDGSAAHASPRVPISSAKLRNLWVDNAFESVSQSGENYVQASGFLNRSGDREYEYDPSNLYAQAHYPRDPFDCVEGDQASSRGSTASSIFASSSVMTIFKAPGRSHRTKSLSDTSPPPVLRRKLSVILDGERTRTRVLNRDSRLNPLIDRRPPSYEYDFDEKIPDDYDDV